MSQLQPPRLVDQVRESIRLRHFSPKTEKSYLHYIRDFILFHHKRHPREMGLAILLYKADVQRRNRTFNYLLIELLMRECGFRIITQKRYSHF